MDVSIILPVCYKKHSYHSYVFLGLSSFLNSDVNRSAHFISEILIVVGLLGEKFVFFKSLGTTKISRSLKLSEYINVVLLIKFPEQFEL